MRLEDLVVIVVEDEEDQSSVGVDIAVLVFCLARNEELVNHVHEYLSLVDAVAKDQVGDFLDGPDRFSEG